MTRIEIYDSLRKLGFKVTGCPNNDMLVQQGRKNAVRMTESEALLLVQKHEKTHCLTCGQKLPRSQSNGL